MNKTVPIDQCPDPSVHGSPFRYCPYCEWREPQEPKPVTVTPNPADARQVETAAIALYDVHTSRLNGDWDQLDDISREGWRIPARAVLTALAEAVG